MLDLVSSCVYYSRQASEIDQVLPYSVDFKLPGNFEIPRVRQYLLNAVLLRIKDL